MADPRRDEALEWVRRLADPAFDAWEEHLAWLEADAANAAAFDEMSLLIEDATEGMASSMTTMRANPPKERFRPHLAWLAASASALAASLIGVLAWPAYHASASPDIRIATRPGQIRGLRLADGTRIVLSGDTAIRIDRADARHVRLDRGEVFAEVTHDARHPFTVATGDARFEDIGTAFDIRRDADSAAIAVREGAVLYTEKGRSVRLAAGLAMRLVGDRRTVATVDRADVGGWTRGQLSYRDAPIMSVVVDLRRISGQSISVDPRLAHLRINAVIIIDHDRSLWLRRVGSVLGVAMRHDSNGWHMSPPIS